MEHWSIWNRGQNSQQKESKHLRKISVIMASTQPSPSQPMVVSTPSGKNRVMPTTASASGAPVAPTPSGSSAMGANPPPAAVALSMSLTPSGSQTNQDLASLFECPVCFDYVLPPILQVRQKS